MTTELRSGVASQRGQVTPLLLVVLLFAVLASVGIVRVGQAAGARASAQAAADASALAGAAEGRDGAERVASANHASVVHYASDGEDVVVTVQRRGALATARARWRPAPIP